MIKCWPGFWGSGCFETSTDSFKIGLILLVIVIGNVDLEVEGDKRHSVRIK